MSKAHDDTKPVDGIKPNALTAFALPKMDLAGPTVDDDIRRVIRRYGADAVKEAVRNATKPKRGRKKEPDWPELLPIFKNDAKQWLEGKDPFIARTNYAIAKDFAERNPGQSAVSTHKRIERKLNAKIGGRRWWVMHIAWNNSSDTHPYITHLRTLASLAEIEGDDRLLASAVGVVADYEAREGSPPSETMTFREVELAVQKADMLARAKPAASRGLFGSGGEGKGLLGMYLGDLGKQAGD